MIPKLTCQIDGFRIDQTSRKKWEELRFHPQWLKDHPEDVKFLIRTRLIYSILGFQNSTSNGLEHNKIKVQSTPGKSENGLWIKRGGEWVSISQLKKALRWNPKEGVLVSRHNPLEKWNYFSKEGLLPLHTSYEKHLTADPKYHKTHRKMRPITHLSKDELDRLLGHAKNFNSGVHSSPHGALQFITHPPATDCSPFLQNLYAQSKVHCGIRLITPDGAVYSFGLGAEYREHLLKKKMIQSLATVNGQPKMIDYLEFQKFDQRIVTTVPLNEKEAENILKQVNFYREKGIRFNVLRQNCVRFATHLLGFANISLDTRISLLATAWRSLPSLEHIPFIGIHLGSVKRVIRLTVQKTVSNIPKAVKESFVVIGLTALSIPKQFTLLLLNLGLIATGGQMATANHSLSLKKAADSRKLENFDGLVAGLLDPEAGYVHHSSIFIHWQLNQKTTEVYNYSGQPNLNILPSQTVSGQLISRNKKAALRTMFQESKPVRS